MIWLFWRRFRPKSAILATFAMFVFLGTSKFEIYMKKWCGNRLEMVLLGGGGRERPLWLPLYFQFFEIYRSAKNEQAF